MKRSAKRSIQAKDAELEILSEMNVRLKESHKSAMADLRERLRESLGADDASKVQRASPSHVERENEYLRSEVMRLKEIIELEQDYD